jgi:hypothetical protein
MTQPGTPLIPTPAQGFGELTYWEAAHSAPGNGGAVSWYPPGADWYIGEHDSYWGRVLDKARAVYGDPRIRYNTDDIYQPRHLVFGDGTPLPQDGTVVYHNTAAKQNFIQNQDGSVTRQNFDGTTVGTLNPVGYQRGSDGKYAPVDASGHQISPLISDLPGGSAKYRGDSPDGIWTPLSTNGDYYTVDPTTGRINYFDKNHAPISEQNYLANAGQPKPGEAQSPASQGQTASPSTPPLPGSRTPMQSQVVTVPVGMTTPVYPAWATEVDPDIPNQMTAVMVRLYNLFGTGTPAQSELPEFPFNTATGEKSGIDSYDAVKGQFVQIETQFDAAAKTYRDAVTNSAYRTESGRQAINTAISTFNTNVRSLPDKDWAGLLSAESALIDQVKTQIVTASTNQGDPVGTNPDPAPRTPPVLPDVPSPGTTPGPTPEPGGVVAAPGEPVPGTPRSDVTAPPPTLKDIVDAIKSTPPAAAANPLGAMGNPLGALGGMNPLGGLGGLGGMNPLGVLGGLGGLGGPSSAVNPLPAAAEANPVKPVEPIAPVDNKVAPISPVTSGPVNEPPGGGPLAAERPAAATPPSPGPTPAPAAAAEHVGNPAAEGRPSVTLPDGKVVEAADPRAAQAAQAALDGAAPGGDAAQKAYSATGVELPSDGKNPGAKVDPADMQPGDVLKWGDKTMVAVAPGLVADPAQPGVTHTLQDALKDPTGFQGVFRPTEVDPTLSAHGTPPPLHDPAPQANSAPHTAPPAAPPAPQPPAPPASPPSPQPGATIPLSGPASSSGSGGQPAPPSPFEPDKPPAAVRSTKADRIAAGQE